MERLLVATDGSQPAQDAVQMAASIAERFGAELEIAYVIPPVVIPPESYSAALDAIETERELEARALLDKAANEVRSTVAGVRTVILRGPVADALVDHADAFDAQLVVVGSRGQGAIGRVLLGSVSDRLVHTCRRPVLVVR